MSTKKTIYNNALNLFSEHGYYNIGMRELAKSVGIKASSIYNHYKSKEEILMAILNTLLQEMKTHVYPLFKQEYASTKEFLTTVSLSTNHFFEREDINRLTNLLIPLEHLIPELREIIHLEFVVKPRGAYTYYFNNLMNKGLMLKTDPSLAAKMYHSFFIYHFYEKNLETNNDNYLLNLENTFKNHIDLFINYYQIK